MEDDTMIHQPFLVKVSYHRKQKVQNNDAGAENDKIMRKNILHMSFVLCAFPGFFVGIILA